MPHPLLARLVTCTSLWLALPLPQDSHFNENGLEFSPDQNTSCLSQNQYTAVDLSSASVSRCAIWMPWPLVGVLLDTDWPRSTTGKEGIRGPWLPDMGLNTHLMNSGFLRGGESAGQSCGLRLTDPHSIPARQ